MEMIRVRVHNSNPRPGHGGIALEPWPFRLQAAAIQALHRDRVTARGKMRLFFVLFTDLAQVLSAWVLVNVLVRLTFIDSPYKVSNVAPSLGSRYWFPIGSRSPLVVLFPVLCSPEFPCSVAWCPPSFVSPELFTCGSMSLVLFPTGCSVSRCCPVLVFTVQVHRSVSFAGSWVPLRGGCSVLGEAFRVLGRTWEGFRRSRIGYERL